MSSFTREKAGSFQGSNNWELKSPDTDVWVVDAQYRRVGWWPNESGDLGSSIYVYIRIGPHTLANKTEELMVEMHQENIDSELGQVTSDMFVNDKLIFHFDTGACFTILRGDIALTIYNQLDPMLRQEETLILADNRVINCPKGPIAVDVFGEWVEVTCCFMLPETVSDKWWRNALSLIKRKHMKGEVSRHSQLLGMTGLLRHYLFCVTYDGIDVFRRRGIQPRLHW